MINFFNQHSLVEGDYNLKDIKVQQQIGRGNSHVYTAFIKDDLYALKQIQIKNDYEYQSFLKEVSYMKQLSEISHDLIHYYGYFVTLQEINQYSKRKFAHIIMECAEMNLQNLITCRVGEGRRFNKTEIIKFVDFLLPAFTHLQKNKIAHCDIKPENILILNSKSLIMKLCDVGSCKIVDSDSIQQATILGTVPFLAPELVKVKTKKIISSNVFKSDVFSFGLVVLYLITNKKFSSKQRIQISEAAYFQVISQWIKQAREIVNYDSRITQVIKVSLQFQEYKRPLFRDVISLYEIQKKRKKAVHEAKIKKLENQQNEKKTKLQQNFASIRTQKISLFKSRNMASKISTRTTSIGFPKITRAYDRNTSPHQLSPLLSPLTKRQSSCFSNISPEKTNISTIDYKKIIYVTEHEKEAIPFEYLNQQQKNFVLFTNCPYIKKADCISIYQPCSLASLYDLAEVQTNKLCLEYQDFQGVGVADDCPALKIKKIYANLRRADLIGGFKYLFKSFCSLQLEYIEIDITGADALFHFNELIDLLDRLNGKTLKYFGLIWQNNLITYQQHTQIIQKLSKLLIKKLTIIMNQNYINYEKQYRWALPKNCQTLYLEYKSNFMGKMISNLSISILHCPIKQLYLNFSNNNLNKSESNILFKSVSNLESLQKLIINFSWNLIQDISYIITSLTNLKQITSLQIKFYHTGVPQQQIFSAIEEIKYLFDKTLKIFKIGYDRNMSKESFLNKVENALDEFKGLKVDVIGYDNKYMMAFVKKTNRNAKSKALTTKIKGQKTNLIGFKPIEEKEQKQKQKVGCCLSLYSNHCNYDNYVCLACSDFSELSKSQYFCKFCIENCKHKGHNIVKIYERVRCCCAYSGYCNSDIAKRICAQQLRIKNKKAYQCLRCQKRLCQGCISRCFDFHRSWVEQCKDAFIFQCGSPI